MDTARASSVGTAPACGVCGFVQPKARPEVMGGPVLLPDRTRTNVPASRWPPPSPGQPPHLPRCVDGSNNERRHTHEWCGPQRDKSKEGGQCSPCGRRRFSGMVTVPARPRAGDGVRLLGPCARSLSDANLPKRYFNYAILVLTGKFREQFDGTYAHTRRSSSC